MNGKFEENLARLAFGDVTPEEAARIEAEARRNPEAANRLAEYRGMREGLRDLVHVPDHQLSNERLRDAILAHGLKTAEPVETASRGLGRGWVWMPVAACALGFGLMFMRHAPTGAPTVVMDQNARPSMAVALKEPMFHPVDGSALLKNSVDANTAKTASHLEASRVAIRDEDSKAARRARRRARFSPGTIPLYPHFEPPTTTSIPDGRVAFNTVPDPKPASVPASADSPVATASSPIVLIDSTPDAQTGAPTATEVGTASNVVVGG